MIEDLSIEQLECMVWPAEQDYPTSLVRRCHEYRKIPLRYLTTEHMRLLVCQKISMPFLLPRAVAVLEKDILAEGDYYRGDLLSAVFTLPETTWIENPNAKEALTKALQEQNEAIVREDLPRELRRLIQAYVSFCWAAANRGALHYGLRTA